MLRSQHKSWRIVVLGLLLAAGLGLAEAGAGELMDRTFNPQNYANSDRRNYYVYVPDAYDGSSAVPMVMVLHGCHQTRDTIFDEFGWDEAADQFGFIVVAPDISTSDPGRFPQCWGYWEPKEIHQGKGEVEDLHHIAMAAEQEWRIDPDRRHITGLSSGGFMANAAAVAHNEYWSSAGVHSGGGYNETSATFAFLCASPRESSGVFKAPGLLVADMKSEMDSDYAIPMMLIHSKNDCTVGYGLEGTNEFGGLTANRDAWLQINGGGQFANVDCSRDGIACSQAKYGTSQRSTLEVLALTGLTAGTDQGKGHYWSGGETNGQWTKAQGPKAADLFWDFFQRHPRARTTPPTTPPTCQAFSGRIAAHVTVGRVYAKEKCIGWWCWFWPWPKVEVYYAVGSKEELGADGSREVTLYTTDGRSFSTTDCNSGD